MTFEKYNANPENKNIGDCSIRAICTATPLTYQQAKKLLETKVFESGAAWNTVKNITAALADLGIEVKAASRETVNSFTKHCDTGGPQYYCGNGKYCEDMEAVKAFIAEEAPDKISDEREA